MGGGEKAGGLLVTKPLRFGFRPEKRGVAGWDNVRILQGGMAEWQAKGGFDAAVKAAGPAKH